MMEDQWDNQAYNSYGIFFSTKLEQKYFPEKNLLYTFIHSLANTSQMLNILKTAYNYLQN